LHKITESISKNSLRIINVLINNSERSVELTPSTKRTILSCNKTARMTGNKIVRDIPNKKRVRRCHKKNQKKPITDSTNRETLSSSSSSAVPDS
jgi:hypothetical protein